MVKTNNTKIEVKENNILIVLLFLLDFTCNNLQFFLLSQIIDQAAIWSVGPVFMSLYVYTTSTCSCRILSAKVCLLQFFIMPLLDTIVTAPFITDICTGWPKNKPL